MYCHGNTSALPFFQRPLSKLVTSLNQNVVKIETSSTMTFLEKEVLIKLHKLFFNEINAFYEKCITNNNKTFGCITSGGTVANLTAMWVARNNAFPKTEDFEGIEKEGVISALKYYEYNDMAIVGSELMHYSFRKAADILGLGLNNIYSIPTDSEYKMRTDLLIKKLEELKLKRIKVIALIGIACTTEVGSIDNLEVLAEIAKKYNIFFHVDGAWGGSFIISDKYKYLLKGIEKADSITIDGHKLLYTPMGCGVILFKSPYIASKTIKKVASYIIRENSMDHGKTTLEGSRPANILYLHASLTLLGQHGLSTLLDMAIYNTKYMASLKCNYKIDKQSDPIFKDNLNKNINYYNLSNENNSKLNNSLYSKEENQIISYFTNELQFRQKKYGKGFVSKTTIKSAKYSNCKDGISVFRVVIANPLVTKENIKFVIEEQIKFGLDLEKEKSNFIN
ncbi:hypothetical protein PIROE2DRAFT_17257 [Piromyces sp. E2]|nr:hypothetical protein PIROE2DRAFT_17257 [Piromyces sp. E2]|eukprot:OUM57683.1 hypothetical protein PIROE2DRAFT_17257 [Piromyces sp. E2]